MLGRDGVLVRVGEGTNQDEKRTRSVSNQRSDLKKINAAAAGADLVQSKYLLTMSDPKSEEGLKEWGPGTVHPPSSSNKLQEFQAV